MKTRKNRVFDLHCDLLSYLKQAQAFPLNEEIGCSLPFLKEGNVGLQVFALYTNGNEGSYESLQSQVAIYHRLVPQFKVQYGMCIPKTPQDVEALISPENEQLAALLSVENAAGLCKINQKVEQAFKTIEKLKPQLVYISLTHNHENRFGGGNYTNTGLKKDGEALLDFLDGQRIALDFSHMSDALAEDCLNYIEQHQLEIPIMASHSNFRTIWEHPRNLPLEFAQAIAEKKGLIGMNFLRAFINDTRPEALYEHIIYGIEKGFEETLVFGADYFYTKNHPDKTRIPFYFPAHEDARVYPDVINQLSEQGLSTHQVKGIIHNNALKFLQKTTFA